MLSNETKLKWDEMIDEIMNSHIITITTSEIDFINKIKGLRKNNIDLSFRESQFLRQIHEKLKDMRN